MTHRKNRQHHVDKSEKSKGTINSVYKGVILTILASVCYSVVPVIIKQLKNLQPGQLLAYRFLGILAFTCPQTVKCEENLLGSKNTRPLLILRGFISGTSWFLVYVGYRYLPIAECAVITKSDPIFVLIAAKLLLKEHCGIVQSITALITVIGIVFSTKVPKYLAENSAAYTKESIYGVLCALGSLILNTSKYIVGRKLKSVHHSIIMLFLGVVGLLEAVILTVIFGNFQLHVCGLQSLYIIILALASYVGQLMTTMALQCEQAGPVSTVSAAGGIFLAFAWQTSLFHEIPDFYSITGAVLVGISVIFVGLQKWVSSLNEESSYRKKLNFMLK